jgi:hypothetical protein
MVMSPAGQSAAMRVMVSCLNLEVDRVPGANAGGSGTIGLDEKSRPHEALKTTDQFVAATVSVRRAS